MHVLASTHARCSSVKYFVPEEKLANILSKVRDLIEAKRVPVRVVASVYGMLAACRLAYGPIPRLWTRIGQNRAKSGKSFTRPKADATGKVG